MIRILIVEDEYNIQRLIVRFFSRFPWVEAIEFLYAVSDQEALTLADQHHPNLITMDGSLPASDRGPIIVDKLRKKGYQRLIVMISSEPDAVQQGIAAGADAGFEKPAIDWEAIKAFLREKGLLKS